MPAHKLALGPVFKASGLWDYKTMNETNKGNNMKLYILNEVLYDYTDGMAVIAAPNVDRLREIYLDEFEHDAAEFDRCMEEGNYQEIEVVNHPEGLVSYVYGGG